MRRLLALVFSTILTLASCSGQGSSSISSESHELIPPLVTGWTVIDTQTLKKVLTEEVVTNVSAYSGFYLYQDNLPACKYSGPVYTEYWDVLGRHSFVIDPTNFDCRFSFADDKTVGVLSIEDNDGLEIRIQFCQINSLFPAPTCKLEDYENVEVVSSYDPLVNDHLDSFIRNCVSVFNSYFGEPMQLAYDAWTSKNK